MLHHSVGECTTQAVVNDQSTHFRFCPVLTKAPWWKDDFVKGKVCKVWETGEKMQPSNVTCHGCGEIYSCSVYCRSKTQGKKLYWIFYLSRLSLMRMNALTFLLRNNIFMFMKAWGGAADFNMHGGRCGGLDCMYLKVKCACVGWHLRHYSFWKTEVIAAMCVRACEWVVAPLSTFHAVS